MTTRLERLKQNVQAAEERLTAHRNASPMKRPVSALHASAEEWRAFTGRIAEHQKKESMLEVDHAMALQSLEDYQSSRVKPIYKYDPEDSRMRRTAQDMDEDGLFSAVG